MDMVVNENYKNRASDDFQVLVDSLKVKTF